MRWRTATNRRGRPRRQRRQWKRALDKLNRAVGSGLWPEWAWPPHVVWIDEGGDNVIPIDPIDLAVRKANDGTEEAF